MLSACLTEKKEKKKLSLVVGHLAQLAFFEILDLKPKLSNNA